MRPSSLTPQTLSSLVLLLPFLHRAGGGRGLHGTWRNPSRRPQEEVKAISKDDCAMPSRSSGDLLYPGLNTNRPSSAAVAVAASSSAPISTPSAPASTQIGRPGVQCVLVFLYQTPTLSAAADLRRSRAVRSQIGGGGKKTTRDGRPDAVPFPR
jgi:hypothetical protein